MSLYKNDITIGGVKCGVVLREGDGYLTLFERTFASLEDIEGIPWDTPEITGECILPAGCGFEVADISYSHSERCYRVRLALGKRYLGDVTGYQEQIDAIKGELQAARQEKEQTAQALDTIQEERDALKEQLDSVDLNAVGETELLDAYEEGVNSDA